jgi:glycosyltransferase involved in cell wall biosynthesis
MDERNKKRGLIFSIAYDPFWGGAEVAVREIAKRTEEAEFDMITLRLDGNSPAYEEIGGIRVHRIGGSKNLFPINAFRFAAKLHKEKPYDFTWSIMANYAGFAALFFKLRFPKVKFLLTLQEGDPIPHIQRRVRLVYPLFRKIFEKADSIQAISNYLADFALSMNPRAKVAVVPNGVDIAAFEKKDSVAIGKVKADLQKKEGDAFLVTASRLTHKNGLDTVIGSLPLLPANISFVILGVGELEAELKALAKRLGVESRVKLVGFVKYEEIPAYLHASDIFIRPSRSEGFGNSFVEAMAAGLPVIATPVGGIVDFLEDKKTGVFCQPDDPASVAKAVELILGDSALREDSMKNAREMVRSRYGWDRVAQAMEGVFKAL